MTTTYYVGYSQQEIYKKRCDELGCAYNSAILKTLSDVPGQVAHLTSLDLSRNFLGSKGVMALLDVIDCAENLHTLDLRDQKLNNDAVEVICAHLRRHPSLVKVDMSNNPITLAVSSALLELVRQNTVLQYVYLENTFVRPSMVMAIEVQLERNRALASSTSNALHAGDNAMAGVSCFTSPGTEKPLSCTDSGSATREEAALSLSSGSGASAATSLLRDDAARAAFRRSAPRQRCPAHELQEIFSSYTRTSGDALFDVNPTKDVWSLCEARQYVFDDNQFSCNQSKLHRVARHTYGIAGWRRIGELYPYATLFGNEEEMSFLNDSYQSIRGSRNFSTLHTRNDLERGMAGAVLATAAGARCSGASAPPQTISFFSRFPTEVPEGFTWSFTALMTAVKDLEALQTLFCCTYPTGIPEGGMRVQRGSDCPGIYAMRVFIEGQWRYLVVDDFFPVDRYGRLVFTKPSLANTSFWPCVFEKMLAKLSGGYHMLDTSFDKHHAGIDGPCIRKPIAWRFLAQQNTRGVASDEVDCGGSGGDRVTASNLANSEDWDTVADDSLIPVHISKNCGRLLSRLSGGLCDTYQLHPVNEMSTTMFEQLHRYLKVPMGSAGVEIPFRNPPTGHRRGPSKTSFISSEHVSVDFSTGAYDASLCSTAAIAFSRDAVHTSNGILPNCGYQIMRVSHTGGVRLLELRNPWCGEDKWTGDWADDSPLWRMNPEVAEILQVRGRGGQPAPNGDNRYFRRSTVGSSTARTFLRRSLRPTLSDSGGSLRGENFSFCMGNVPRVSQGNTPILLDMQRSTFWISYTDFLKNFGYVHLCRKFSEEFHRQHVHGSWSRHSAGGSAWEPSWHTNPHYRLSSPCPAHFYIQLTRRDPTLRTAGPIYGNEVAVGGIGLQLLHDTHYPLHCSPIELKAARAETIAPPLNISGESVATGHYKNNSSFKQSLGGGSIGATVHGNRSGGGGGGAFTTVLVSEMHEVDGHLSLEVMLDAGDEYWVVPTTYAPRVLDEFDLAIISAAPFMLQEAQESEYWHQQTVAPGELCSSPVNTPQVGQNDDELAIKFDSHTRVAYDSKVILQSALQCSTTYPVSNYFEHRKNSRLTKLSSLPCRMVVAATANIIFTDEVLARGDLHKEFGPFSPGEKKAGGAGVLRLAILPGVLGAGRCPVRVVGEIDSHATRTYELDRETISEALITPNPLNRLEHYTAICSLSSTVPKAEIHYRVWCAAPLLEVQRLPLWSKREVTLSWDDAKGSGNYHEASRHPQVELSRLVPFGRFIVSVHILEHDTVDPALSFTVVAMSEQPDEPLTGQLERHDLRFQSACVDGSYVEANFDLDEFPPESLVIIPCLQPAGTTGKCTVTISSDTTDYCIRLLPVRHVLSN